MSQQDIGQLSSFQNDFKQKGLLTFYQQQWQNIEKDKQNQKQCDILSYKSLKKNQDKTLRQKTLINISKDNQKHYLNQQKVKKQLQQNLILKSSNIIVQTHQRIRPNLSVSLHMNKRKKYRQNQLNKQNIFQNSIRIINRLKRQKNVQSIPIKSYPFEEKQQLEQENQKLKNHLVNIRIKNHRSFKCQQNNNRSSLQNFLKVDDNRYQPKSFLLENNQNQYDSYKKKLKNPVSYLFPIIAPECLFWKKNQTKSREKDSLSQFLQKMNIRQKRNTDSFLNKLYQKNQYA